MEKLYTINQQKVIEIDEIYDEIEEFKGLIENLAVLSAANNIEDELM